MQRQVEQDTSSRHPLLPALLRRAFPAPNIRIGPHRAVRHVVQRKIQEIPHRNICEQSFKEIWRSERYWEVMNYLASPEFNAQKMYGSLCLQHKVNESLDNMVK